MNKIIYGLFLGVYTYNAALAVSSTATEKSYYENFVNIQGTKLIKIMMSNASDDKKYNLLLKFVNKNMDVTRMGRAALSMIYRAAMKDPALSEEKKKQLESKIIKYLCITYVRLAKDKASTCGQDYSFKVKKTEIKNNAVVVYSDVKLCNSNWNVNIYFLKSNKKPINITFDNISVLDKNAFYSIYKETGSITKFEQHLDNILNK